MPQIYCRTQGAALAGTGLRCQVVVRLCTAAGVVAETIFDQRWHGFAVVLLNAGLIAEFVLFKGKFV